MKVSTVALSFLSLAAALRPQTQVINDTEIREEWRTVDLPEPPVSLNAVAHARASDCCFSYTSQKFRCTFMEAYFETSSGCSQPAVIFVTKKGQRVCADPGNSLVQKCKRKLKPNSRK